MKKIIAGLVVWNIALTLALGFTAHFSYLTAELATINSEQHLEAFKMMFEWNVDIIESNGLRTSSMEQYPRPE